METIFEAPENETGKKKWKATFVSIEAIVFFFPSVHLFVPSFVARPTFLSSSCLFFFGESACQLLMYSIVNQAS